MLHLINISSFSYLVDQHGLLIQERFSRLPLKMDVPEKILSQAHVQPGQVADFLHENGISFQHSVGVLCENYMLKMFYSIIYFQNQSQ